MGKYENGVDTQRVILAASKKLFFENGFDNTTYDDICQEAHVNRSSVYYHFKSKENIRIRIRADLYQQAEEWVSQYCHIAEFTYILASSVLWYYGIKDPVYRRFSLEAVNQYIYPAELSQDFFDQRIRCFTTALKEEELKNLDHSEYAEGLIELAELNLTRLVLTNPEKYTLEEVVEMEVMTIGKVYNVPHDLMKETCRRIREEIHRIPYAALDI